MSKLFLTNKKYMKKDSYAEIRFPQQDKQASVRTCFIEAVI